MDVHVLPRVSTYLFVVRPMELSYTTVIPLENIPCSLRNVRVEFQFDSICLDHLQRLEDIIETVLNNRILRFPIVIIPYRNINT